MVIAPFVTSCNVVILSRNRLKLIKVIIVSESSDINVQFSASFLGRLPKVDLIILEGKNVRPSVHPSVRPSTESFFDLNEIWYVGRGR